MTLAGTVLGGGWAHGKGYCNRGKRSRGCTLHHRSLVATEDREGQGAKALGRRAAFQLLSAVQCGMPAQYRAVSGRDRIKMPRGGLAV